MNASRKRSLRTKIDPVKMLANKFETYGIVVQKVRLSRLGVGESGSSQNLAGRGGS